MILILWEPISESGSMQGVRRVAVVETDGHPEAPETISATARGVRRILWDYGACWWGQTDRPSRFELTIALALDQFPKGVVMPTRSANTTARREE